MGIFSPMKRLNFVGNSRADLDQFPADARRAAGFQLYRVQLGFDPHDWKPMPSVGAGVYEIRLHEDGEFRVFYVAKYAQAIYVLHAFQKKTQQTRKADIDLGKQRLKLIGDKP
jgi:phage-related protein